MRITHIVRRSLRALVLLPFILTAAAAEAVEGFYFGAEMVFANVSSKTASGTAKAAGDGAGIMAGYGIDRHFSVEASAWATDQEDSNGSMFDLKAALLTVKASLPLANEHVSPYVMLGAGKYQYDRSRGEGWRYGAGMDVDLAASVTLTIGFSLHAVDLGTTPRESVDISSMDIGICYRFR